MPRLLLFAVCQKLIIDRDEASPSLINVISSVTVSPKANEPIPPDSVAPMPWGAISVWWQLPEDEGKSFESRVTIFKPDGTPIGTPAVQVFRMTVRNHVNPTKGDAFPVGQPGVYTFRLDFREVGEGNEWQEVADYPLEIVHATEGE